jgi:hypothetical protein
MLHTNTRTGASLPRRRFSPHIISLNLNPSAPGKSRELLIAPRVPKPTPPAQVSTTAGHWKIVRGEKNHSLRLILTASPV